MRRFNFAVHIAEIDLIKADYCIDTSLIQMVTTCKMVYEIFHDKGEIGYKFEGDEADLEEPQQPGKDTIASQSTKIGSERPI